MINHELPVLIPYIANVNGLRHDPISVFDALGGSQLVRPSSKERLREEGGVRVRLVDVITGSMSSHRPQNYLWLRLSFCFQSSFPKNCTLSNGMVAGCR